ncbi:MAG TPA: DUF5686 family protein [Cyclobacteriaceae bacterium]|nr:DUF5686 family protein [Cyclobacteriaceae bacterium]
MPNSTSPIYVSRYGQHQTLYLFAILFIWSTIADAQPITLVRGRVTESGTGNPIPFANVYFHREAGGTITDFDGNFSISTHEYADSLTVSFVGYSAVTQPVTWGIEQDISFDLHPESIRLDELIFYAGENPAFNVIRNVIRNKKLNDKRSFEAYEYESYNLIEVMVNHIPEDMNSSRLIHKISSTLDSVYLLRDEGDNPMIPVFISENLSRYYVKNNPEVTKEEIMKTRISGLGIEDGSYVAQFLGSSFQEYNFYRNWLDILDKDFVSPIADGWKIYYDFDILDSLAIDHDSCYLLNIIPRNEKDLAFNGKMWITKKDFALKQIDVTIGKEANLNFIHSIRIQQALEKTVEGPWIPSRTRVTIEVSGSGRKYPGFLVKFNNSSDHWILNHSKPPSFYNSSIELLAGHREMDHEFWNYRRQDSLSTDDRMTFKLIDTLRNIPAIKRYTGLLKFAVTGYVRTSKIDYGPALYTYAYNDIEGHRFRIGIRTNEYLSEKWYFRTYGAYGLNNDRLKYGIYGGYIFDRKPWTELMVGKRYDVDQVGIQSDELVENYIFLAFTRFGHLSQPYYNDMSAIRFRSEFSRGFTYNIFLKRETFEPLYNFAYFISPGNQGELGHNYINTAAGLELRYARDETFVTNGNQRLSLGINRAPAVTMQFTQGIAGLFGGEFTYRKLVIELDQKLRLGFLGTSFCRLSAGKVFNAVPYPLLFNHIGNETSFYSTGAFSTMNYFEFASDSYISLRYQQFMGGYLLSRLPLISKLKWRLVGNANMLWGRMSNANRDHTPLVDELNLPVEQFGILGETPFIELGYGIENILKFIRIDAFHRLTYLDNNNVHPFQVKLSFQVIL